MIRIALILSLALAYGPVPDEDLDKALAKAASMESYTFSLTASMEGGGGQGARGRPLSAEVAIQGDRPWRIKAGETEAYRKGEAIMVKDKEGAWKKLERPSREEGEREGRRDRRAMALRGIRAPHQVLKDLSSKMKDIRREDGEGGPVFSGELTPEAAREFGAPGRGRRPEGDDRPEFKFTGRAKVWVNKEGLVTRYEIATEATGTIREQEVTLKRTTTVEIRDVGTTKVEVPEEVEKAFGA